MNPILFLTAKLRLFIARCKTDAAKRSMQSAIKNTRAISGGVNVCYDHFLKCAIRQEEMAVGLKRILNKNSDYPIGNKGADVKSVATSSKTDIILTKLDIETALARHRNGDWGDVGIAQWRHNNQKVGETLGNIESCYSNHGGARFYINTRLNDGSTFIRLEDEA